MIFWYNKDIEDKDEGSWMEMRRRRNKFQTDEVAEVTAKNSQSGAKITHLSDKSVSKQTKKIKEMNRKALAYIHSVK